MTQYQKSRLAPGPRGTDGLRLISAFRDNAAKALLDLHLSYGNVVQFFFGKRLNTLICHPEHIQSVLQNNAPNYSKGIVFDAFKPLIGEGLLTSNGDHWRRQRKLAQPAFQAQRFTGFVDMVAQETMEMVQHWQARSNGNSRSHEAKQLDLVVEMHQLTFVIIAKTLFSTDFGDRVVEMSKAFDLANQEGTHRIRSLVKLPMWLPTTHNRRYKRAVCALEQIVNQLINERRQSNQDYGDLLSRFLSARDPESGQGMSDQQLRDEILTFLFAGHETTSSALCWIFALLAQHPKVLEMLRTELQSVLGDRPVQFDDLVKLIYTRRVIQESMRLYPSVYAIQRRACVDQEIGG